MTQTATANATGITIPTDQRVSDVVDQLTADAPQTIAQIPMCLLQPNPDNPAERMSGEDIGDLADSISAMGILEPLIVATAAAWQDGDERLPWLEPGQYVVVAGHRRLAGARKAYGNHDEADSFGLEHPVPCIIRDDLVGADADVALSIENGQRRDLTPIQEAEAYARLRDRHAKTQTEIAKLVGRNQSHISKRLELLKLPEDLQAKAGTDELPIADAVAIAKHSDDPKVMKAIANRPSYQSIEDAAKQATAKADREAEIAEAKKNLKAQGVTVVAMPQYGLNSYDTPRPLKYLASDGLKTAEHEHWECHAIAVGFSYNATGLQLEPVCTNPSAHPESRESKTADDRAKAQADRDKEQRASVKRRAARLAVIGSAVAGKLDAATDNLIAQIQIAEAIEGEWYLEWTDCAPRISDALGLEINHPAADDMTEAAADFEVEDATRAALLDFAAKGPTELRRTAAAVVLIRTEDTTESSYGNRQVRKVFLEWLRDRGHKLAAVESQRLKEASA